MTKQQDFLLVNLLSMVIRLPDVHDGLIAFACSQFDDALTVDVDSDLAVILNLELRDIVPVGTAVHWNATPVQPNLFIATILDRFV